MRLTRIVLSMALALLVLSGCASVPRRCDDRDFSEVDKVIAVELFDGQIREYRNGVIQRMLVAGHPSSFGINEETMPVYWAYVKRAREAQLTHYQLIKEDPDYRRRWKAIEQRVLRRLGDRVSDREARPLVYHHMLRACIYDDIFTRLGPPEYEDQPYYDGKDDPRIWGSPRSPFFSVYRVDGSRWPASVQPFHYCSGTGGLTVTGGDAEPHVRAWKWLMAHDERFRADWERVLAIVAPEARRIDPLDTAAARRVTDHWRRLLLEGGEESLAARIEARVREEAGGQPPGDEGP